jgi:hypothetical protein
MTKALLAMFVTGCAIVPVTKRTEVPVGPAHVVSG